ncbi:YveK family protein [Sulfobacillus thermosulfidooxidans]|uniref:YveK family protein n=1 Tax=Sulfobacillus thermosulfidooxidans TaxID=28034 RepID=UPI0002DD46B9|nr:Wzz/FepE/Etk N-terminal domain-containing protein [Sulfobacillus thermosulfidooxidans]
MKLSRRIKRHMGISVSLVVLTTSMAFGIAHFVLHKSYTSTATLLVIPSHNANSLISALQLTQTYADLATSNRVWNTAAEALADHISAAALESHTKVSAITNTDLITIQATAPSAVLASEEATQVALATMNAATELTGSSELQLSSPAAIATQPSFPDMKKIELLAFLLSAMGAIFLAVLREHFDTSLQTEEDIQQWLHLPVWAMIPRLKPKWIKNHPIIFPEDMVSHQSPSISLKEARIDAKNSLSSAPERRQSP